MAIYAAKGTDDYAETLTGGAIHTKGSWVQLLASTAENIGEVRINPVSSNAIRTYLIDVGTGAGGAESVLVANVILSVSDNIRVTTPILYLPVNIPSGTRIAGRVQADAGSTNSVRLSVLLIGGTVSPGSPVTYGANTASTTGTTIDPGAVANTKGSYVQVTASTSANHTWLAILISGRGNPLPSSAFFALDTATGAGGAESVQIPDMAFASNTIDSWAPTSQAFPLVINSGTRIACRAASSVTDATDRTFDVVLIGAQIASSSSGASQHNYAF